MRTYSLFPYTTLFRSDGDFEDGRYRLHLRIDPYVDPTARTRDTIEPGAARLMLLALDVEWGDGGPRQSLQLQTLRLSQPDAFGGGSFLTPRRPPRCTRSAGYRCRKCWWPPRGLPPAPRLRSSPLARPPRARLAARH